MSGTTIIAQISIPLSYSKNSIPGRKLVAIATKRKKRLKNLVQNYWSDLKIIWHKWSFADSCPRLFILFKLMKKNWPPWG